MAAMGKSHDGLFWPIAPSNGRFQRLHLSNRVWLMPTATCDPEMTLERCERESRGLRSEARSGGGANRQGRQRCEVDDELDLLNDRP